MLGVFEVDVHEHGEDDDDEDVDGIARAEDGGEPACLGAHVDGAEGGRLTAEDIGAAGDDGGGDVVHHEGEQGLVGAPVRLKERGDERPQRAAEDAGDEHDEE